MKKAQTDIFLDVMSYFLFVIILIVFFIIFHFMKGCNNPAVEKLTSNTEMLTEHDMFLVNLLRTPVEVDGKDMPMTELIWMVYDDKHKDILEKNVKSIMVTSGPINPKTGKRYACWQVIISGKEVLADIGNECETGFFGHDTERSEVAIALPLNKKELALRVSLTLFDAE